MKTLRTLSIQTLATISALFLLVGLPAVVSADDGDLAWMGHAEFASQSAIDVVVFLDDYEASNAVFKASQDATLSRAARVEQVGTSLESFRSVYDKPVYDYIDARSQSAVTRIWIVPAFTARLTPSEVEELAAMPGVKRVVPNVRLED